MLIPLDYYRILGLPIQATAEQIQQAYRDRSRQMPRREYSEMAVRARKQLIDEAYEVLSDPDGRARYDATFLSKTYDLDETEADASENGTGAPREDAQTPSLDIEDEQLVGALPIFLELGEYELVLKLGRPHLVHRPKDELSGTEAVRRADFVLTVAVAYLEMGREQWQQSQYERAASCLEAGQALLLREGLFPQVRGEMQADLYKLRPYRVLELLSLPLDRDVPRQRGLQLLRDMIQERSGIDGSGDDRSGLDVDDFLRFVQQLRQYMTAAEQQLLFEMEARRPSAVATYLAVYALVGRGFAERQPGLIYRAKLLLIQLGRRQDVHLEQAICALLLGQTEQATRALELSQEESPITFIRENSQGSPDLLPGLCLYGERWLQEEVFPHFRDLANQTASLKDYFADPQVQTHLENLPPETEESNQWVVSATQTALPPPDSTAVGAVRTAPETRRTATAPSSFQSPQPLRSSAPSWQVTGTPQPSPSSGGSPGGVNLPLTNPFGLDEDAPPSARRSGRRSRRPRRGLKIDRLVIAIIVGLVGLTLLGFILTSILGGLAAMLGLSEPKIDENGLDIGIAEAPVELPEKRETAADANAPIDTETARATIQNWLDVKADAMGSDHQIDKIQEILTGPALTEWQALAERAQTNGWYWEYQHDLNIGEVTPDAENPNRAVAAAQVREQATLYEGGQPTTERDDNLNVMYELVRSNGTWKIQDWVVE
ncbi:IMS domain-containing protein [Baaleninema sp.]|uniref:IMS domain-containing protein n=1 Tax=Baaleninema sp. TaxID=3101197 RepID=UPI003D074966